MSDEVLEGLEVAVRQKVGEHTHMTTDAREESNMAEEYRPYRRTAIAEMADWHEGFDMAGVSVSEPDRANGSPLPGDKIARNPKNHDDRWLVAAAYFADNFEPVEAGKEHHDG